MKKILTVFFLMVSFVVPSYAELKVDIVAGAADPISIAVQKFEVAEGVRTKDAAMMREVVEKDLQEGRYFDS